MLFDVWLQAVRAGDLPEDRGRVGRVEGADRLQRMRALVSQVHARARFDEAQIANGAVGHQLLQALPAGMKLQLMIDGDLDLRLARDEVSQRYVVLALNRQRFLHNRQGDAGRLSRFEDGEPNIGRRADLDQFGFFSLEHLAVIGVAR